MTTKTRTLVGYWIQREEREVPYLGEYAGHNEMWRLHIGETPILRCAEYQYRKWVTAQRPATRIAYSFWNRIGAHGSLDQDNEPKLGTHGVQMDGFNLANAVRRGEARLVEGYTIRQVGVYSAGCGSLANKPMIRVFGPDGEAI